ncbi:MAG: glycosyltransferase [Chloroflexi bacterium]|nr:glycosyltransferase [Chloroflexota bacterium]
MTVIYIAGMHRSGTSMVTRLLNLCGVYLGQDSDLFPPDVNNSEGYWENRPFTLLNDELLADAGGGWDYPPPVNYEWEKSYKFPHFVSTASELTQQFSPHQIWGWKDPRNSLTYPFWKKIIPSIKMVVCVRNPDEVANSLIKRNIFSPASAFNLWFEYNQRILRNSEPKNRIITHYDSYFKDPYSEITRVLKFLNIDVPENVLLNSISAVTIPLRHNQSSLLDLISSAPSKVIDLYEEMCTQSESLSQILSDAQTEVQPSMNNYFREDDRSKEIIRLMSVEFLRNKQIIIEKEQIVLVLSSQLAEKEQILQVLSSQVAEKEQIAQELSTQMAEKEQIVQVLSSQVAEKEHIVQALSTQMAEKEHIVQALSTQMAEIANSKTWKIALLFRRIRASIAPAYSRRARMIRWVVNIFTIPFGKVWQKHKLINELALIKSSDLFDEPYYLTNNPDVALSKVDPGYHYLLFGGFEGRNPSPNFCSAWYLTTYVDVKKTGMNPLVHYLSYGKRKGLAAQPDPGADALRLTDNSTNNQIQADGHGRIIWAPVSIFKKIIDVIIPFHTRRRKIINIVNKSKMAISNYGIKYFIAKVKEKLYQYWINRNFADNHKATSIQGYALPMVDIVVPVYNALEDLIKCIEAVLSSTQELTYRLIIIDDVSTDPKVKDYLEFLNLKGQTNILILRNTSNIGFVKTVNRGMSQSKHNDVVLLNSDTVVTTGWLDRLQHAAYYDDQIATVTPLSNNATICSVPEFCISNDLPDGYTVSDFANLVFSAGLKARKQYIEIPTAIGFCMLIKRNILNEIGLFDEVFGKGYNEENDFCMRARIKGYKHVVDVSTFVFHKGRASFQGKQEYLEKINAELLNRRYPFYSQIVNDFIIRNPLQDVQNNIKRSIIPISAERREPIRIGIDTQALWRPRKTGTERYIISLLDNFKTIKDGNHFILYGKPDQTGIPCGKFIQRFAVNSLDILLDSEPIDLMHRTYQCYSVYDLLSLMKAKSSVITILDLISYKHPEYFLSQLEYNKYKQIMHLSLILADRIIAISHYTKEDIINNFNVPAEKIDVIYPGFSGMNPEKINEQAGNWDFPNLERGKYFLYIGTDYPHKNHEKLIQAYRKLKNEMKVDIKLVIAGPSISPIRRQEIISQIADLKEQVVYLEYIDDQILGDLYKGAAAYIFPSLYEGFGFTPLEAMANGIPVVASNATSIPEVVGEAALLVNAENINELSDAMYRVLIDSDLRKSLVQKGFEQMKKFQWTDTANQTLQTYNKAWNDITENGEKIIEDHIKTEIISLLDPAAHKFIHLPINNILHL